MKLYPSITVYYNDNDQRENRLIK